VSTDRFISRLVAITVCLIGLGLTAAYITAQDEAIKDPLLLVVGALLAALRLGGHNDEPVQFVDATSYPPAEPNP
jgi:hypothetical protein